MHRDSRRVLAAGPFRWCHEAYKKRRARETALHHLRCMAEVLADTGSLWENYCAESSTRGSWSASDYSWSALGPIALLFEVVMGLEPRAGERRLRFTPPVGTAIGVKRYPLGPCMVDIRQEAEAGGDRMIVETDYRFTLEAARNGDVRTVDCPRGKTEIQFR